MLKPISEKIEELKIERDSIEYKISSWERVSQIVKTFDVSSDRWNKFTYSPDVNDKVNGVEFRNSCGCCSDSLVYAYPFYSIEGLKIYSSPVYFTIGENNYFNGILPWSGWKDKMKDNQIPSIIIEKCQNHLDDNIPEDEDEDDD